MARGRGRSHPGRPNVTLEPRHNGLNVTWNQQNVHVDYYQLQYKAASRSDWRNVMGVSVGTAAPIHLLKGGTAYDVRVRGVNEVASGLSIGPWSNTARGTPTGDEVPADIAAFGLQAAAAVESLFLMWNEPESTVTGFQVQHKASNAQDQAATTAGDPSTGWVDVAHTGTDTMTTIRDLTAGTNYDVPPTPAATASGPRYRPARE